MRRNSLVQYVTCILAFGLIGAGGCGGQVATAEQFEAASATLRAVGIDSYRLIQDTASSRYTILLRNQGADVGELDAESIASTQFLFNGTSFTLQMKMTDKTFDFTIGNQTGHGSLGSALVPDAASASLWDQAKPQTALIALIQREVKAKASSGTRNAQNDKSCSGFGCPGNVNCRWNGNDRHAGWYPDLFCVDEGLKCNDFCYQNCPYGRYCSYSEDCEGYSSSSCACDCQY